MEYATLGKTNRTVSRLGFGGTVAGLKHYLDGQFNPEDSKTRQSLVDAIHTAHELGITYFDTAFKYGFGVSEEIFGEALSAYRPQDIFLATKANIEDGDKVRASLEASLKRLRRDSIDLLQIHGDYITEAQYETIVKKGGMLDAMRQAKHEGLVGNIGFTIECQNESLHKLIRCGQFDTIMLSYNFIFQHPYDPSWACGSMYDAEEEGLGIVLMRSLTSGIFQKWIRKVNPRDQFDYNPALLQFVLSNPLADVALIGMRSAAEVEANVRIVEDTAGRIDIEDLHRRY